MISSFVALALSAAALVSAGDIDKPYAYEDGLSPHFKFRKTLPKAAQTNSQDISTPDQCTSYASNTNGDGSAYCPSGQFTSKEVTFDDCGATQFCACNDGQGQNTMSMDHMVGLYSRLPPALKQNIRYMLSMPSDNVWAETFVGPNDILVFGDAKNSGGALDIFIHEAGHALDQGNSSTQEWIDAVNADGCVPDSYASSNYVEDFAQVNVVWNWLSLHDGQPPDSTSDLTCMQNQLTYFKNNPALSMTADSCVAEIKSSYGYSRRRRSVPRRGLTHLADEVTDDIPVIRVAGIEGVTV